LRHHFLSELIKYSAMQLRAFEIWRATFPNVRAVAERCCHVNGDQIRSPHPALLKPLPSPKQHLHRRESDEVWIG